MQLDQLRAFAQVAQQASFTRAADALGVQKSQVSRQVAQLEAALGLKLMERSTRHLSLTEAGRELLARARAILDAVDDTLRMAQQVHGEPQGVLRLTCGVEFGMLAVSGWIARYLERYPKASVEADFTARVVDLVHDGFDLAIRVGPIEPSRLVARPLGEVQYGLFASPDYLRAHPLDAGPEALARRPLLLFLGGGRPRPWTLNHASLPACSLRPGEGARLRVNNVYAVRDAVLAGQGIGQLPLLLARDALAAGQLRRVLPDWSPQPAPIHAVYPSNRFLAPKVRAFIDLALQMRA